MATEYTGVTHGSEEKYLANLFCLFIYYVFIMYMYKEHGKHDYVPWQPLLLYDHSSAAVLTTRSLRCAYH